MVFLIFPKNLKILFTLVEFVLWNKMMMMFLLMVDSRGDGSVKQEEEHTSIKITTTKEFSSVNESRKERTFRSGYFCYCYVFCKVARLNRNKIPFSENFYKKI